MTIEHLSVRGGHVVPQSPLGALLAAVMDDLDDAPTPTLAETMRRLIEEKRRIREAPSFTEGQWVTPRSDVAIKGAGEPNLVIRSRGHEAYVISVVGDQVASRWIENWQLEPWDQSKHEIA